MRASTSGQIIGTALQALTEATTTPGAVDKIIVLANLTHWENPANATSADEASLSADEAESWLTKIWDVLISKLTEWFKTAVLAFKELFAEKVATKELCIGDTCITEAQLKALLNGNPSQPSEPSSPSEPSQPSDTEAPVITLIGLSPITLEMGVVYSDPGATVTDNKDQNLGYKVTVNLTTSQVVNINDAIYPSDLVLDTSAAGEYTITYVAVDQAGNTGTATRTVTVVDPNPPSGESADEADPPSGESADEADPPSGESADEAEPAPEPVPEPVASTTTP